MRERGGEKEGREGRHHTHSHTHTHTHTHLDRSWLSFFGRGCKQQHKLHGADCGFLLNVLTKLSRPKPRPFCLLAKQGKARQSNNPRKQQQRRSLFILFFAEARPDQSQSLLALLCSACFCGFGIAAARFICDSSLASYVGTTCVARFCSRTLWFCFLCSRALLCALAAC